jgi:hypothetical protein
MRIGKSASTSRSINAAGTINASGADYAEYMKKSYTCGIINKGDICGINSNGELTDIYDDSIHFVVKSTNPSYVGGDTWGGDDQVGRRPEISDYKTEEEFSNALSEWNTNFEITRSRMDRIAFSGIIPVNVYNTNPGDYIIPNKKEDGKIEGISVSKTDITFEQHKLTIGKVLNILHDGRASVKVLN